jgi:hypothetical protein
VSQAPSRLGPQAGNHWGFPTAVPGAPPPPFWALRVPSLLLTHNGRVRLHATLDTLGQSCGPSFIESDGVNRSICTISPLPACSSRQFTRQHITLTLHLAKSFLTTNALDPLPPCYYNPIGIRHFNHRTPCRKLCKLRSGCNEKPFLTVNCLTPNYEEPQISLETPIYTFVACDLVPFLIISNSTPSVGFAALLVWF